MNIENIHRVANYLEVSDTYSQAQWSTYQDNGCKTPGCIAGHAAALLQKDEGSSDYNDYTPAEDAATFFDLDSTSNVCFDLFDTDPLWRIYVRFTGTDPIYSNRYANYTNWVNYLRSKGFNTNISREAAAKCLRNMAETGKVDWQKAIGLSDEFLAESVREVLL